MSNSGSRDYSPVRGTENQIGNEFISGKWQTSLVFYSKADHAVSTWKLCNSLRGRFSSLSVTRGLEDLCQTCKSSKRTEDLVGVTNGNQKSKVDDTKLDV